MISAVSAVVLFAVPADNVPTLFHNDEVWYKDETAPALLKDGVFHVPSDFIAMFDYITVTTERDGENLLFTNEQTGDYVSVLYISRAACVNGTVWEDISIFRENGYYYLDVDFVCGNLGLLVEYSDHENITDRSIRVYDEEKITDFVDLLASYSEKEEESTPAERPELPDMLPEVDHRVRIRLICTASEETDGVIAWSIAEQLGFTYDAFLTADFSLQTVMKTEGYASLGLAVATASEAEKANERLANLFFRKTHVVLSTGDEEEDALLGRRGYVVVKPDFSVSGTTDAAVMFNEIVAFAGKTGEAVIFLGDVWQSETLLLYLNSLNRTLYNIGALRETD